MDLAKNILFLMLFVVRTFQLNLELVIHLKYFFGSDVILASIDNRSSNDEIAKKFYKSKDIQLQAFIGTINLDEQFERNLQKRLLAPYQNTLVVTTNVYIKKLIKNLLNLPSTTMASIVWVNFVDYDVGEEIRDLYIPFNSRFFLVKRVDEFAFEIKDVYQVSLKSPKIYSVFAYFNETGMKFVGARDFDARRKDLKGHQFVVSRSTFPRLEEAFSYLWKLLAQGMNFSVLSHAGSYGYVYPNGSVGGLFKLVVEHKVDGTTINYSFTKERLKVLDYIFPTMLSEWKMYVHVEPDLNWTCYIAPFRPKLWLSIVAWIGFAASIIHVMLLLLKKNKFEKEKSFLDSLFDVTKAVSNQGALLSHITVQIRDPPIRNLEEFIEDGSYKLISVEGVPELDFFRTDQGVQATAMRKKNLLASPEENPADHHAGFHKICEGQYIFALSSLNLIINESCYTVEIQSPILLSRSGGILTWKGFPYKNAMTKLMRQIQFAGLQKLKQRNIIVRKEHLDEFVPLSLELIFPAFLLYGTVLVLCSVFLLCEIYFHKKKENLKYLFREITNIRSRCFLKK